jgi:hypothetical protein
MMPVISKPDITKKISMPMKPVSRKWQTAETCAKAKIRGFAARAGFRIALFRSSGTGYSAP